jgi:hypothetical protein
MKKTFTFLLLITLSSCGVNYNLHRMAYHKRMAIAKGAEIKSDTVFTDRVYITPGDSTTVFLPGVTIIRDTTIYQDRIKIRIRRDTVREMIQVECPPDTVKIRVPVAVNETLCPPPDNKWKWIAGILACIVVGIALIKSRQ